MEKLGKNFVISIYIVVVSMIVFGNLFGLLSDIVASVMIIFVGIDLLLYALVSDKLISLRKKSGKKSNRKSKSKKITKRSTFGNTKKNKIYNSENKIINSIKVLINFQISLFCSPYNFFKNSLSKKSQK